MTAITFSAKREIVPRALNVTGTDLSASSADNSFNSLTTDLSGLVSGDWVYVSGFVNATLNGWHPLSADSTSTKIIVSSTLVTEASGANVTIKGYEHGSGQSYNLETASWKVDPVRKPVIAARNDALDGSRETLRHRADKFWLITTDVIHRDNLKYWEEFFASIEAGELFTLDPYGTISTPDNPVSVEIEEGSYTPKMVGNSVYHNQFTFRVRVQS